MDRVSIADVRRLAGVVGEQLKIAGKVPKDATVALREGNRTCGRTHRLFYSEAGSYAENTIHGVDALPTGWPVMGNLGWTKREAYHTLSVAHDELRAEIASLGLKFGEYAEYKNGRI